MLLLLFLHRRLTFFFFFFFFARTTLEAPRQWESCILEPQAAADVLLPATRDPRDVMIEYLFRQKRFSAQVLQKALLIYTQSRAGPRPDQDMSALKAEIVRAVEAKIRSGDLELDSEKYREQELACWGDFLTTCVHYWRLEHMPLALFASQVSGHVHFVRQVGRVCCA